MYLHDLLGVASSHLNTFQELLASHPPESCCLGQVLHLDHDGFELPERRCGLQSDHSLRCGLGCASTLMGSRGVGSVFAGGMYRASVQLPFNAEDCFKYHLRGGFGVWLGQ